MSEVNILFEDLLKPEAIYSDTQLDEPKFFTEIVDEIVDNALGVVKDHEPAAAGSLEDIAHSVLLDIIRNLSDEQQKLQSSSSSSASLPSSESKKSSESSYRIPSYLLVRPQVEVPEKVVEETVQVETCEQYDDIDKIASVVVEKMLSKAVAVVSVHIAEGNIEQGTRDSSLEEESESYRTSSSSSVVEWPSIEIFNEDLGVKKIYEFMDTWDYEEDWLYCVNFLIGMSDECSDYYRYQALWSIPTQMYPIPQATASIYFTIERSRVKPQHCPVNVTYVYEGSAFVHTLESAFSEDRLFEIIDAKLKFYQRLTF